MGKRLMTAALLCAAPGCFSEPGGDSGGEGAEGSGDNGSVTGPPMTSAMSTGPTSGLPGTAGSTTAPGESTGDADSSSSTGSRGGLVTDDFDRPDGPELGGDWFEKTPDAWRLLGGQVVGDSTNGDFRDNYFWRTDVSWFDARVSAEFVVTAPSMFPQVAARIDAQSSFDLDTLTAYTLQVDTVDDELQIWRTVGPILPGTASAATPIASVMLDTVYRLNLVVEGMAPVSVFGLLEESDGRGGWIRVQTVVFDDFSADAIVDPGSVGASGINDLTGTRYDNFEAEALTP